MTIARSLEPCECGAVSWRFSATIIECKVCGRIWGRVNGAWVLDISTVPGAKGIVGLAAARVSVEAGERPCGLSFDQLITACRNVGIDLSCAGCAANFFTGTGGGHDEDCKTTSQGLVYEREFPMGQGARV